MLKNFSYAKAGSLDQAAEWANTTAADLSNGGAEVARSTVVKAGGIDLLDMMKEGLLSPDRIVAIHRLEGHDQIQTVDSARNTRLGCLVTLAQLADNDDLKQRYTALAEAADHAATPNVRRMATLGGNLMQRPRCPYFRSKYHNCLKKGGDECYALTGPAELHAIFNNQTCAFVHASSVSTGLLAFDPIVTTNRRDLPLADFFVTPDEDVSRENVIEAGELIVSVQLNGQDRVSAYQKTTPRDSYDWALVDVAVSAVRSGNRLGDYRVVLGAVGPQPMRATEVENYLNGKSLNEKVIRRAGELATQGATPLDGNAYKIPMLAATVRHVLTRLA